MRYIGIDLGTTNSTISIANINVSGEINPLTLEIRQPDDSGIGTTHDELLPSALYIDQDNIPYVGSFANRMSCIYKQRVIKKVKRYIGKDVSWKIDDKAYRPEVVSSYVLKTLKTQAEEHFGGEKIDSAVITVPANFNFQQDNATRLAAELAGFEKNKIHTIPEPTAALIDFLNEEQKQKPDTRRINLTDGPKNLLVFDLGGGTCDVSILRVSEVAGGEIKILELSISQYMELGGMDFDDIVMRKLLKNLLDAKKITPAQWKTDISDKDRAQVSENLLDIAEKARKNLAMKIDNVLRNEGIDYIENHADFDDFSSRQALTAVPDQLKHTFTITKKEYDEAIKPLLYEGNNNKNIEYPIKNALKKAKIGPMSFEDIDAVFAVGGMIQYPTILHRIYEIFGKRTKPLRTINPMTSVSRGAAVYHYYIDKIHLKTSNELTDADINDITKGRGIKQTVTVPQNIYVDVIGSDPVTLLEKGTEAPHSRLIENKFAVSGGYRIKTVNAMELKIFSAEDSKSSNITEMQSVILHFKRPVNPGAMVTLKVDFNEERKVTVSAWLKDNPKEVIDVTFGEKQYTDEEIQEIRNKQKAINKVE